MERKSQSTAKFRCSSGKSWNVCEGEPFFGEHMGKTYCVLHFPGADKARAFDASFMRLYSRRKWNFAGIWFPHEMHLSIAIVDADADFSAATFNGPVDFRTTQFKGNADFKGATFNARADFGGTIFESAASFQRAIFNAEAEFYWTNFHDKASFREARFKSHVWFTGGHGDRGFLNKARLDLSYARIERPEQVSFHTLTLNPNWFVNVDPRKFEFTNVKWNWPPIEEEVRSLASHNIFLGGQLLAIACRNLADNAETNYRYEEASRFRYRAMDVARRKHARGFGFWRMSWWYWLASGYGERTLRAFIVLIGILLIFAMLFTRVGFTRWKEIKVSSNDVIANGDEVGMPLSLPHALTYSAGVMTLQKPDPRPVTMAAQTMVLLETILGPVQAALLALAIRRKFMR